LSSNLDRLSTRVRERAKAPCVTIAPDATLEEATTKLLARRVTALPVVEGGRLVGLLSSTDLVGVLARAFSEDDATAFLDEVRARMSSPARTISGGATLADAVRELARARVHRLVVTEGGAPDGVLSARDLLGDVCQAKLRRPIGEIMTTLLETIDLGEPLEDAVRRLSSSYVHGLVVLDGTKPIGVFTHAEALELRKVPPELRRRPVEEAMSYETICLDDSTPLHRAAGYADAMRARRILVVRQHRLVGIVSTLDMVMALASAEGGGSATA